MNSFAYKIASYIKFIIVERKLAQTTVYMHVVLAKLIVTDNFSNHLLVAFQTYPKQYNYSIERIKLHSKAI